MKTINQQNGPGRSREIRAVCAAAAAAHESVTVADAQNRLVYVNPAFEKMYGWTLAEALCRTPEFLLEDHVDAGLAREVMRTTAAGRSWRGTLANISRSGETLRVDLRTQGIFDGAHRLVGMVGFAVRVKFPPAALSPQQARIYRLLGQGCPPKEIAYELGVKETTVREQFRRMVEKIPEVRDNRELACHAIRAMA